ncbi:fungal-specific transcription factor domain-containing protein, partial [Penicillium canescens]
FIPKDPTKRKRVSVACKTCRSHKIRCDGGQPQCGTCQRRREPAIMRMLQVNQGSLGYPVQPVKDNSSVTAMGLVSRPFNEQSTGGFFGDSSTVAFIKQLQNTVSKTLAPLQESSRRQFDRESARNCNTFELQELLPPRPLADHVVDCYFSKIHVLYPFPFNAINKWPGSRRRQRESHDLLLWVECDLRFGLSHEREAISEAFFHTCKPALDVDYLEYDDLALAQTLLLMAHYLQGS